MSEVEQINQTFYDDIQNIILEARLNAVNGVEYIRVMMYWHIGERIFVEEQHGQNRAVYGEFLIKNLAVKLENEFGSGFSEPPAQYALAFTHCL